MEKQIKLFYPVYSEKLFLTEIINIPIKADILFGIMCPLFTIHAGYFRHGLFVIIK